MFEPYNLLLAAHILGAIAWVGGGAAIQVLAFRAQRSGDAGRMLELMKDSEWLGTRLFFPSSIVLLIAGVALVVNGGWGFSTLWVVIGIAGYLVSAVVGSAVLGPRAKKLAELLETKSPEDAEVTARLAQLFTVARIDLLVLIVVVLDMTLKPG